MKRTNPSRSARGLVTTTGLAMSLVLGCGSHVQVPADAKLGMEYPSPDEEQIARDGVQVAIASIQQEHVAGQPTHRDAHIKAQGCVRGTFTVSSDLPPDMQTGLFSHAGTYPVWIRYSNGLPKPQDDNQGNVHGMALKVMSVPGDKLSPDEHATQDFLLVNTPVFMVPGPAEYLEFSKAVVADRPVSYFLGWNPFAWKIHDLLTLKHVLGQAVPSVLAARYWSILPFRMGTQAVKWSAKPCSAVEAHMPSDPGPEYLREDLAARLGRGDACFTFMAQRQQDPVKMPIEDATVGWNETESPFVPLATVSIPSQTFTSPEQMTFCENLSFSPWHALPEHRPLGGLNRIRQLVYGEISKYRHDQNQALRTEPTGTERF